MFGRAILHRQDIRVSRGDRFFMYSDGLIESSPGGGRRDGLARLVDACVHHRAAPLGESAGLIAGEVRARDRAAADDLLLLAAEAGE
jgi:serine phosphatase RsbU (regulator of sigma subunit)